jgi:hypothetical protein
MVPISMVFTVGGHHRHEGLGAKFGGFLHQQIHFLAFQQALRQGQRDTDRRAFVADRGDPRCHLVLAHCLQNRRTHLSLTVEQLDGLPWLEAQHRGDVPCLRPGQFDQIAAVGMVGKKKASHGCSVA